MTGPRRRADAGIVRATPRDVTGLSWVIEMYGMPFDLIKRQLAIPSDSAARNLVSRWRHAGWVESAQLGGGPFWVWATAEGIAVFGERPYKVNRPSAARVAHHRAVIEARLSLEQEYAGRQPVWVSERELRYELGRQLGSEGVREHTVDGVIEADDDKDPRVRRRIGVEVELSPKALGRLVTNMALGAEKYDRVLWLVAPEVHELVEHAWFDLDDEGRGNTAAFSKINIREVTTV